MNIILLALLLLQAGIVNPNRAVGEGVRATKMEYKAVRDCLLESYRGKQNIDTYLTGNAL